MTSAQLVGTAVHLDSLLSAANQLSDGLFIKDSQGRYLFCNPVAAAFLQLPADSIVGRTDADFLDEEMVGATRLRERNVVQTGLADVELRLVGINGETRWIQISRNALKEFPARDSAGKITGVIGTVRDITPQHVAEETVQQLIAGSDLTGESYFQSMLSFLCRVCKAEYAFVGRKRPAESLLVETISVSHRGNVVENFSYDLRKTPCEEVTRRTFCHFPTDVQSLFPEDELLALMGIDSYMGISLCARSGELLGIVVLVNTQPFENPQQAESLLRIITSRTAAELEREYAARELERNLHELRVVNQIGKVCSECDSLDRLLSRTTTIIAESLFPDNCGFLVLDPDRQVLIPHWSFVLTVTNAIFEPLPLDVGIIGRTVRTGVIS
ncbi:MAG: PAS domain-containing protein, partial [Planctomycetaceae bacterium]|nr:PAS domain-containing protein [Planctomycetaceae bacterium]